MTTPTPIRPKETMVSDLFYGAALVAVLEKVHTEKITGQIVINLAQGAASTIELRHKIITV